MSAIYYCLGFVSGAAFVLVLFTVWYSDEEELQKQADLIRQLVEFERKAGKK